VLRCLAWQLGMCKVASEKKRAVSMLHRPEGRSELISCRSNLARVLRR
jgi:hypothetical protein